MFSLSPAGFIAALNTFPPELVSIIFFLVVSCAALFFLACWGRLGLFVFMLLSVICGNIQVLKIVQFSYLDSPVALGTILFGVTYLCTDILTEHFSPKVARQAVVLSFVGDLFFKTVMLFTLGWKPLFQDPTQEALTVLFTPSIAIFAASVVAYFTSQFNDIWIYEVLKKNCKGRYVGLRSFVSTSVSALLDNTIFSVLAWVVFAPHPVGMDQLIYTYILGTYGLRVLISCFSIPFIYVSYGFVGPKTKKF